MISLVASSDSASLRERFPSLESCPIVGIVRRCPPQAVVAVVDSAVRAGLRVIEVTLDSSDALDQLGAVSAAFPDVVAGVGTVLEVADLEAAVASGARFVVTPAVVEDVCLRANELDVPCITGASTPTEIHRAHRLGATAVKVFPISQLGGAGYLNALRAPLGGIDLVPTGGVDASNAAAYLDTGAVAIAVGSSVFSPASMASGDFDDIQRRAEAVVRVLP